nr:SPOR domain-containing protein [uncultured Sphingomonas sp.]
MAAPTERLPWLHDEPPAGAATAAQVARKKPALPMWPWYLLLLVLVGAVAAGAWWLSTAEEAAPPQLPAEQSLPIPATTVEPSQADESEQVATIAEQPTGVPATPTIQRPRPRPSTPVASDRVAEAPLPATAEDEEGGRGRSLFPADEPAAAPPPAVPNPVAAYNPRPYAGRVVQLGAFPTRAQAEASWKRITRRYPYLASKPKMVNTVDVRSIGGGRPTRMFRLQLGTSSQAQSVVICQQLERAGHSCVVVY